MGFSSKTKYSCPQKAWQWYSLIRVRPKNVKNKSFSVRAEFFPWALTWLALPFGQMDSAAETEPPFQRWKAFGTFSVVFKLKSQGCMAGCWKKKGEVRANCYNVVLNAYIRHQQTAPRSACALIGHLYGYWFKHCAQHNDSFIPNDAGRMS